MTEYNPDAEYIVNVEPLNLYMLLLTYKDGYKCIFDFSELVPKFPLYKQFQDDPDSFYNYKLLYNGLMIAWDTVQFASDNIREDAVPFDDVLLWIRKQMHRDFVLKGLKLDE